ncbi:hypothetical protein [Paenibacillus pinistramenti]|uniref:hypothetical protein n=1 Tax=Paenibacillus pinistramenti TaxID=1768003 RepID=UPI003083F29F
MLASLGEYIYFEEEDRLSVELYVGGTIRTELAGIPVTVRQDSSYTSEGRVQFTIDPESPGSFTFALRMPDWCEQARVTVNGEMQEYAAGDEDGYITLERIWQAGDQVEVWFAMPVKAMESHPLVRQTFGKAALQRGPFVYCLEEADNGKGLYQLRLSGVDSHECEASNWIPGGVKLISVPGYRLVPGEQWRDGLYRPSTSQRTESIKLSFIPYFAWANRGVGEMSVWVSTKMV